MSEHTQPSVGRQVWFAFGALCAILLSIGGLFFFSLQSIERGNQRQSRARNTLAEVADAAQDVERMQTAVLRQLLASDTAEIRRLDQTVRDIESANAGDLADAQHFVDTERERQLYDRVIQARAAYWEQTTPVLALGLTNRDAEATELIITRQAPAYDESLKALNELANYVEADADETAGATARVIFHTRIAGDALAGIAIFMALGTAFGVGGIARRLKNDNVFLQTEVAERKRAEDTLRESEERFSNAFEYAPIGVALVSLDGRWLKVNRALCDLLGYSEAELLTRNFKDMTDPTDLKENLESVRRLTAGVIRFYQIEKRYVHASGHFVLVLLNVSLVRDSQGEPSYFISQIQDITERKQAETALKESEERFRSYFEFGLFGMAITSPAKGCLEVNDELCRMLGYARNELLQKTWPELTHPDDRAADVAQFDRVMAGDIDGYTLDKRWVRKDGRVIDSTISVKCLRRAGGLVDYFVALVQDVTERKRLEARLFESQKLETVGKLAGGIAHEFNSILTAIIGQSDLLLGDLPPGSPLVRNATEISQAAGRAATLTRQLLAYGRKQMLQQDTVDLNQMITNMESVFLPLMGEKVHLHIVPDPGLSAVKADAGQIEQVIMNMVINARDAMPKGGDLTLETANVTIDEQGAGRDSELKPGNYVMLAITDTGVGMSEDVRARVFDPFFTTKGVGEGTGLGLSTSYGIVKQSGGHIGVASERGRGTTFRIYLPQAGQQAKMPVQRLDTPDLPRGMETILLVEADPALREMAAVLLERLGYIVLAAGDGAEALSLSQQRDTGHIDLLLADVAMPHMGGRELSERILALHPHTRILFTSAYTGHAMVQQGGLDNGVALLQKPFTPSALARKLREVLDQPRARTPETVH